MSTLAVRIAKGGLADLPAVMAVMDDSFDPRFGEAWTASQCAGLLPLPGVWLALARNGDEIVGFSLSRIIIDEAELLLLAVRHAQQGRGIGGALLADFASAAIARGAGRLHLEVRDGNLAARLYEQAGYSLAGRRRDYYLGVDGGRYDALTLMKKVGPGE
ncbi:GNAT family N-acetyltransferase [Sphingosinicella sp.]|uniref:GNAT family N-acetyltransferase n=1 Tax=Sphingosinicella sp. TaxID=1917971 RepID=UPI004037C059